jgi:hypothetical protein
MVPKTAIREAERVREEYERIAETEDFPEDLCGLCARASAELFDRLKQAGHPVSLGFVDDRGNYSNTDVTRGGVHVFLIYNGTHVIDVTATQFGTRRKVLVDRLGKRWYHQLTEELTDIEELIMLQENMFWAGGQAVQRKERQS